MTKTAESEARDEADPAAAGEEEAEGAAGDAVVITVKDDGGEGNGKGPRADVAKREDEGNEEVEVCRICHLNSDRAMEEGSELILIGCGCKNELGTAHRHCAETWFRLKGNRCCEICGLNAKNITGEEDDSFIEEWHDNSVPSNTGGYRNSSSERVSCWRGQPFCNFLMACLVIAFILPWFFRVNMF